MKLAAQDASISLTKRIVRATAFGFAVASCLVGSSIYLWGYSVPIWLLFCLFGLATCGIAVIDVGRSIPFIKRHQIKSLRTGLLLGIGTTLFVSGMCAHISLDRGSDDAPLFLICYAIGAFAGAIINALLLWPVFKKDLVEHKLSDPVDHFEAMQFRKYWKAYLALLSFAIAFLFFSKEIFQSPIPLFAGWVGMMLGLALSAYLLTYLHEKRNNTRIIFE